MVDVGCGTGNILELVRRETGIRDLCGIDISPNYVSRTKEKLNCDTFLGSVLDRGFVEAVPRKFDFAILGALLHHLVGRTRGESRGYAFAAVANHLGY